MVSLSGFVITKDAPQLERCVKGLMASCDEVVVVDTGSSAANLERIRALDVRLVEVPWHGFGETRRIAVRACRGDFCFFLDSDEHIESSTVDAIRRLRSGFAEDGYRVTVNDWATTRSGRRFLFRRHSRCRIFRRSAARYESRMIVHETPQITAAALLPIEIEHDYYDGSSLSRGKRNQLYSILWAIQNSRSRRRPPALVKAFHWMKCLFGGGALLRGGLDSFEVVHREADYHSDKYRWLGQPSLSACISAYEEGRVDEVLAHSRTLAGS